MFGRRRYLPELGSSNYRVRSMGERMALNAPIQGSAADIIKKAMIDADAQLEPLVARMLLSVHDELVFEVPEDRAEEAAKDIKAVMESAAELRCPLVVEPGPERTGPTRTPSRNGAVADRVASSGSVEDRSRFRTLQRAVATAILIVGCGCLLTTAVLSFTPVAAEIEVTWGTTIGGAIWSIALLAFPIVGWLIVRRQPHNLIGWLMLWVGVAAGVDFLSAAYSVRAMIPGSGLPLGAEVANVGNWGWMLYIATVGVFITHLFPSGRPLSRRWGRWLWVLVVLLLAGTVGSALQPGGLEVDPDIKNPFGVEPSDRRVPPSRDRSHLPVGVISGVVCVTLRYRRAGGDRTGAAALVRRGCGVVAAGFAPVMVLSSTAPDAAFPLWLGIFQDVVNTLWSGLAVAVGIAIFRYRLYAIDVGDQPSARVRVAHGAPRRRVPASVIALQPLLRPITGGGELAIAGSTLVVAALFGPFRRRIQAFIDRRFYRARYDAGQLVEAFSARMRDAVDLDGVVAELRGTAERAVQPQTAWVWLRPR